MDTQTALSLELAIRAAGENAYTATLCLDDVKSAVRSDLAVGVAVTLDVNALRALTLDPVIYGAQLSAMIFADQQLREGWATAAGYAGRRDNALRLQLNLDPTRPMLHTIRWELLQHPQTGQFLATSERILFSRYLSSPDATLVQRRPRDGLRALALIAGPNGLSQYRLAPIDTMAEARRARVALSTLEPDLIVSDASGRCASLDALIAGVRAGCEVLYLLAHGGMREGKPYLLLEAEDGGVAPTAGETLVSAVSQLAKRPLLIVLASCQSAGAEDETVLSAIGPQLIRAGVPAVLAMQGSISMIALATLMPKFFHELHSDGQIDRSLAVARTSAGHLPDWWRPVLYSRLRDGRLWEEGSAEPAASVIQSVVVENPFGRIGRLDDVAAVFGREDLLRRIFEELAKGVSVSLVGERQVGKSSLLSLIRTFGPKRLHLPPEAFIYLNMQMVDDENDFFEALCAEMGLEPLRGSRLARALRGRQYVVCLDEIEKMTNGVAFSGAEREQLRGLADGGVPLRLVIASSTPLERLFPDSEGKTSPLANICQKIDVQPFTPKLAREFLSARLEGTGLSFTTEEVEGLIRGSGGHPARLQRAAAELFERYRQSNRE